MEIGAHSPEKVSEQKTCFPRARCYNGGMKDTSAATLFVRLFDALDFTADTVMEENRAILEALSAAREHAAARTPADGINALLSALPADKLAAIALRALVSELDTPARYL